MSTAVANALSTRSPGDRNLTVLGEEVDVLMTNVESSGTCSVLTQRCPPGGGPPLHMHTREDETFLVLEGEFEFTGGAEKCRRGVGGVFYGPRNVPHRFHNIAATDSKLLIVCTPGGLDEYLTKISSITMPPDMARLIEISDRYGVVFLPS